MLAKFFGVLPYAEVIALSVYKQKYRRGKVGLIHFHLK